MQIYLRLTNDFAFKYTFGNQDYPILMQTLIKTLIPEEKFEKIEFLNTEPPVKEESQKRPRYDVKCKAPDGDYFLIEMQVVKYNDLFDRLLIYSADTLGKLLKKGDDYSKCKALYVITILDYCLSLKGDTEEIKQKLIRQAHLRMDDSNTILSNKLNFIFLQLPNTKQKEFVITSIKENNIENETISADDLAYLIGNMHTFEEQPIDTLKEGFYKTLFSLANKANMQNEDIQLYDRLERDEREVKAAIETAQEEYYERGRKEGEERGRKEGEEKGFLLSISRLSEAGFPPQQISDILKIDIETVNKYLSSAD